MPLIAEFDIGCEHLPFVDVAAVVPRPPVSTARRYF
jgi:hypothetical protein